MSEYLTPEGLAKLKRELSQLKDVERRKISKRIKDAAAFGDLKENAAYHEAKEEQAFLEGKILELESVIRSAKLINKKDTDKVQLGSIVLVRYDGEEEKFQIVGPEEVDVMKGKISYESPLGKTLLGKKKGQEINVDNSEGKLIYKILDIS